MLVKCTVTGKYHILKKKITPKFMYSNGGSIDLKNREMEKYARDTAWVIQCENICAQPLNLARCLHETMSNSDQEIINSSYLALNIFVLRTFLHFFLIHFESLLNQKYIFIKIL